MLPLHIRIFSWIDHHPGAHWFVAWAAFAAVLATALAPLAQVGSGSGTAPDRRPRWLRLFGSNTAFILAVFAVFCAFRWPIWFAGPLDNPDEAEWIAGALTLRDGGLPWKHLDCHTSGPLNSALLLLTIPLGLPLDYVGVRILTMLLQAVAALGVWGAARRFGPEWTARLALLPVVSLWACRWHPDITQYSSEHASVLLLSLAGWVGAIALTTTRPRVRLLSLVVAGALTTTPLFAKLQAAPVSAVLGLLLLGAVWLTPSPAPGAPPSRKDRLVRSALLAAGALLPLVGFFTYIGIYGLVNQVRTFYWTSNILYVGARNFTFFEGPDALLTITKALPSGTMIALGTIAFGLLASGAACTAAPSRRGLLTGAWLLLLAAIGAVLGPGRIFLHYLHFIVLPLGWLAAVSLTAAHDCLLRDAPARRRTLAGLAAAFLLITSAWSVWQTTTFYRPMNGQLFFWRDRQLSPVGAKLRELAKPGEALVVWGWTPGYYVESGLGMGARIAHTLRLIDPNPQQDAYRNRFLFDLRRNRPRWFVDAVAPNHFGYQERSMFGFDTWLELREIIEQNYQPIDDINGVRIYRRKD